MFKRIANFRQGLSPNLRRILGNTAWLFGEKVFQLGFGLLVGVWVARYLKPEGFGSVNYSMAYVALLEPIAKLGLDNLIVRDLARDPSRRDETLGTGFVLRLISSSLCLTVLISTIWLVKPDNPDIQTAVAIFAVGSVFSSFNVIEFWFQSQVQAKYIVVARNSAYIFINFVKIALIQFQAPLIAFVVALVLEQVVAYLSMVAVYLWRGHSPLAWRFKWDRARSLLTESWLLIISGIVIFIYMQIDQLMLGSMVGEKAVGIYSSAVKVSVMWYFVPISIVQSVFPSVVQARDISQELYERRRQKVFNLIALIGYSVAIPLTFLSQYLMPLLYGQNYASASSMLAILAWSGIFASLGVVREALLTTEGLLKFSAVTAAMGALTNVIFNFLLIPQYEGNGAAIATVISQIVAVYLSSFFYRETRPLFFAQTKALAFAGLRTLRDKS